jgi:hypothetical protein
MNLYNLTGKTFLVESRHNSGTKARNLLHVDMSSSIVVKLDLVDKIEPSLGCHDPDSGEMELYYIAQKIPVVTGLPPEEDGVGYILDRQSLLFTLGTLDRDDIYFVDSEEGAPDPDDIVMPDVDQRMVYKLIHKRCRRNTL